jgi:hypothetical protein
VTEVANNALASCMLVFLAFDAWRLFAPTVMPGVLDAVGQGPPPYAQ